MLTGLRALGLLLALVVLVVVSAVAGRMLLPDIPGPRSDASRPAPSVACPTPTIVGRYYSDSKAGQFLEFRADGTVFMSIGGGAATYAIADIWDSYIWVAG